MDSKVNNNEKMWYAKEYTSKFCTGVNGEYTLKLWDYENGDNYGFKLSIHLEGLFSDDDSQDITIEGKGIYELSLLGEVFEDIAKNIKSNV